MEFAHFLFAVLLILSTVIPLVPSPHWFFRIFEFGKIQLLVLQVLCGISMLLLLDFQVVTILIELLLAACTLYNSSILFKYLPLNFSKLNSAINQSQSDSLSLITANVYKYNKNHERLLNLIRKYDPDLLLVVESDKTWERSLEVIEENYPYQHKIPLDNTYGMHFYSKLKVINSTTHYFVANDIPSVEVELKDKKGNHFSFFGVHPPPPSPTEETTSNERDGELISVAKRIANSKKSYLVAGDFNTVAWSKPSILFGKLSQLKDARIGRGFLSTFHAGYWLLRFPIDLVFHSKAIEVVDLKVLENIGSDHFPLLTVFSLSQSVSKKQTLDENLNKEEVSRAKAIIEKGKSTTGDRDSAK